MTELWDLERIGITQENLSPSERETASIVRSSLEKSDNGYIVYLLFKDESRPSVNYRNTKGQLNSLIQTVSQNENLGKQYNEIVNTYLEKDFIEEIPNEPIAGHYLPHHTVFKKSATTPVRIVFNASSKPTDGTSLNDCLLTGSSLTAKLHDIFRGVIWGVLGGGNCPPQDSSCPPPPPKPQLAPHILQAPRSNSSWFSIIATEIQMCYHFNITFSYILYFFFFFCD